MAGDLRALGQAHAGARVEVEDDAGRGPGLLSVETPLVHVEFEGGLLPEPDEPGGGIEQRVGDPAVLVVQGATVDPGRCVVGEVLLEEGLFADTVRPPVAGRGRPAMCGSIASATAS